MRIEAPVVEVTLLEDRARVVRAGKVALPAGHVQVSVPDVAPVLSDRTLSASATNVRVLAVRATRSMRPRAEDLSDETSRLEEEMERLATEVERTRERKAAIERQIASLARLQEVTIAELGEDAGWGQDRLATVAPQIEDLERREEEVRACWVHVGREEERLAQKAADLERRAEAARKGSSRMAAEIVADLSVPVAGECEIRFEYTVPGACWRPQHVARLTEGASPRVAFECGGCVWQETGEDWQGVALRFSTQRPSLGVEPPMLESDVLDARPKPSQVAVEARDQKIQTTGLGVDREMAGELPGIDDRGEVCTLAAAHKADVRSDGRPCRVPIFSFEAPAETARVLVPEVASSAVLRSAQTNASPYPLLAGPVELIRAGGFVGRTPILYVAPGERFPLGWGPDGALRVHREVQLLREKEGLLGSWITQERRVSIQISNIAPEERELQVTERVPVSEIEKVEIDIDQKGTTGGKRADENGFVRWDVRLRPFARETLQLVYTVRKHKDVVGI